MSYYFWMITWVKNMNNFQIENIQPQGIAHLLFGFFQFQPDVAYKIVAYKKNVYIAWVFFAK